MSFFATFNDIGVSDIIEFPTKEERDAWINFQDELSLFFGTTKENAPFARVELTDETVINSVINDHTILHIVDENNPHQINHLRSLVSSVVLEKNF